jgi:cysteine-rich repeat protein
MRKGVLIVFLVVLLFVILFQFASADILSLNSGGDDELVINPDSYLEGFFSGIEGVQVLSTCGNGILEEPYEECDDGNYENYDGCSATCKDEEGPGGPSDECSNDNDCRTGEICLRGNCITAPLVVPGTPYIRIDPPQIKRSMLINSNIEETIGITHLNRTSATNFSIYSTGFDPDLIVSLWDEEDKEWVNSFSLGLSPGEIYELRIRFSAPGEMGLYNGTIIIDGKNASVSLNVQEKLLLFDSNIIVLNPDYMVPQGENLRTSVTLIPLGDKERMDVTLNYVIKDYDNRVYLTRSETVLVEDQINFRRNFDTGVLPLGSYIVALELIYSNGVAPSSAHFEVVQGRESTLFGRLVFFLVNIILIILILIILLIIWRMIRQIRINRMLKEKSLNLVITSAEYGTDDKSKLLSSFIVACKGKDDSELIEIGKVVNGVKKEPKEGEVSLDKLNELLKPLITSEKGKEAKISPELIVAITCHDTQKSSNYDPGWELKSPIMTVIKQGRNLSDVAKLKDIEKNFGIKKENPEKKDKDKPKEGEKPKEEDRSKENTGK